MNKLPSFFSCVFLLLVWALELSGQESEKNPSINETKSLKEGLKKKKIQDDPVPIFPPPNKIPKSLLKLGEGKYFSSYAFVMDKLDRTLSLWQRSKKDIELVGSYPADLGKKSGNKHTLGDLRTPEGIYFFQEMYEGPYLDYSNYGLRAFTMDYPNFFDRLARKTGSGIWLHSIPEDKSLYRGSRGCIVVRNHVIQSISSYIQKKITPIIVKKKVEYIFQNEHEALKKEALQWLISWKEAWESKNLEDYLSYYENNFSSQGKNKRKWRRYKKTLNDRYNHIRISIKKPVFYFDGKKMIARFLQIYQSDGLSDFGEKFLYLVKREKSSGDSSTSYGIVGEMWTPLSLTLIAKQVKDLPQKIPLKSSKNFSENVEKSLSL